MLLQILQTKLYQEGKSLDKNGLKTDFLKQALKDKLIY
jgi:hypothetical protein